MSFLLIGVIVAVVLGAGLTASHAYLSSALKTLKDDLAAIKAKV
jgi:hypothetical protein